MEPWIAVVVGGSILMAVFAQIFLSYRFDIKNKPWWLVGIQYLAGPGLTLAGYLALGHMAEELRCSIAVLTGGHLALLVFLKIGIPDTY